MRGIKRTIALTLLILVPAVGAANARPAAPERDAGGWPDTRVGALAGGWVAAFSAGEDSMRAFLRHNMSEASLAKRRMSERIATYRGNRERFGTLMLASVVKESRNELRVKLLTADGKTQTFVFTLEAAPPYKLESVGMLQNMSVGGHFGFH